MKVAVVGAGGVGSLFGGRLAAAGHEVVFVAGNHDVQLSFPAVQVTLRRAIITL